MSDRTPPRQMFPESRLMLGIFSPVLGVFFAGHSAQVKMRLLLNGSSIPVAQMGPEFLILQSATEHPPGDATLELRIDASERRWKVRLPHGISKASRTVAISQVI